MSEWMTVRQVAEYLQLSPAKVYELARAGDMPASRVGRQWRFSSSSIDRWLAAQDQSARKEPVRDR